MRVCFREKWYDCEFVLSYVTTEKRKFGIKLSMPRSSGNRQRCARLTPLAALLLTQG